MLNASVHLDINYIIRDFIFISTYSQSYRITIIAEKQKSSRKLVQSAKFGTDLLHTHTHLLFVTNARGRSALDYRTRNRIVFRFFPEIIKHPRNVLAGWLFLFWGSSAAVGKCGVDVGAVVDDGRRWNFEISSKRTETALGSHNKLPMRILRARTCFYMNEIVLYGYCV